MKKFSVLISLLLVLTQVPSFAFALEPETPPLIASSQSGDASSVPEKADWSSLKEGVDYVPGQVLLTFSNDITLEKAESYVKGQGWDIHNVTVWDDDWKLVCVRIADGQPVLDAIDVALDSDLVLCAEPNLYFQFLDGWDSLKEGIDYVPDQIMVTFFNDVTLEEAKSYVKGQGWDIHNVTVWDDDWKLVCVRIADGQSVPKAIATAENSGLVFYAEPNLIFEFLENGYRDPWYVSDQIMLTFSNDVTLEKAESYVKGQGWDIHNVTVWDDDWKLVCVRIADGQPVFEAIDIAAESDLILYAEPNHVFDFLDPVVPPEEAEDDEPGEPSNDVTEVSTVETPWYVDAINLRGAWDISKTAGRVSVAVLDTGFYSVPDLTNNIDWAHGWDAVNQTSLGNPLSDHGTAVAGVLAAQADNGYGIDGVSFNANVVPINMAFCDEFGRVVTNSDVLVDAIGYLLSAQDIQNLKVINISAGMYSDVAPVNLQRAINRCYGMGISVVCAAGNGLTDTPIYPSDLSNVISVMATDRNNEKWQYGGGLMGSDYGFAKTLCAPGFEVLTTNPSAKRNYLHEEMGTSLSAPIVSGVLCLMYAANPDLTPNTAKYILESTALDLGDEGYDEMFGWGLVDAEAAVREAARIGDKTAIFNADITGVPSYARPGDIGNLAPVVELDGAVLELGADYDVVAQYAADGNYIRELTVVGKGNYYGAVSVPVRVLNPFTRVFGDYALDTMSEIVESSYLDCGFEGFEAGSDNVIVVTMDGYLDALTAAGLAGLLDCPILMTDNASLSQQTADAIEELGASHVYVMGGTSAISDTVVAQLGQIACVSAVERLAGDDARDTAHRAYMKGMTMGSWGDTCIIATINSFLDGLVGSPYSFNLHAPVFLVDGNLALDNYIVGDIATGGFSNAIILGGTSAVSSAVEGQLSGISGLNVTRMAGDNAMETARLFAERSLTDGLHADRVTITTALEYYDGLCGGPFAGRMGAPILYDYPGFTQDAASFISAHADEITHGFVLGGPTAVSNASFALYSGILD